MNLPWWIGKGHRFYDRHEQLEALFDRAYNDELPTDPEEYWEIVGTVWKRTEFPCYQVEAWLEIFSCTPGPNAYTQEWLKKSQCVYRGRNRFHKDKDYDWSWTTDRSQAEWFANRFASIKPHEPEVLEFDCKKDPYRVWCVFEDDPENEVLLWSPRAAQYYDDEVSQTS